MIHFAKNKNWDDDLWESLVAPGIGSNLLVESWLRGLKEGSYCKPTYKYTVLDVKLMSACCGPHGNITWKETQDHAKWAVPLDKSGWLCIGDINRMTSQRKRGGGAVCFKYLALSEVLYGSVQDSYYCNSTVTNTKL